MKNKIDVGGDNGYSRLSAFIHTFDNTFTEDFCNTIINEYKEIDYIPATTDSGEDWRSCMNTDILNNADDKRKDIDKTLFESLQKILEELKTLHPTLNSVTDDSGYDLLRYKKGDYYNSHIDAGTTEHRVLSCIIALNEDYLGGEIDMWQGASITKLRTGSVYIFPSSFMFPHGIRPVTKGIRYSIVTWFNYGNPNEK
jgi:predicted 2-oxoglutarate/Fe(II)-dependent dioxygenase YbiX